MIVDVIDGFQVRCVDKMNWQVYQRCQVKKRNDDKSYSGITEEEWVPLASYHRSLEDAVVWIASYIPKNKYKGFKMTLDGFLKEMEDISNKIEKSARKMGKAVCK